MTKKLLLVGFLASALSAQGAIILGWNFDGGITSTSVNPATVDAGLNSQPAVANTGLTVAGGNNGGTAWGGFRAHLETSISSALTANDYFSFTIDPKAGNSVDLDSFTISVAAREGETEGRVHSFGIYSSLDGFASQIGTAQSTPAGTIAYNVLSFDLSSLPTITSSTSFRLAAINTSAQVGQNPAQDFKVFWIGSTETGVSDIAFNGVVAVPEPSTIALFFGLAVCGLAFWRRK